VLEALGSSNFYLPTRCTRRGGTFPLPNERRSRGGLTWEGRDLPDPARWVSIRFVDVLLVLVRPGEDGIHDGVQSRQVDGGPVSAGLGSITVVDVPMWLTRILRGALQAGHPSPDDRVGRGFEGRVSFSRCTSVARSSSRPGSARQLLAREAAEDGFRPARGCLGDDPTQDAVVSVVRS